MTLPPATRFYDGPGFDALDNDGLAEAYDNTSGLVAFIDETYRAPSQALKKSTFYILTAVVIERDRMAAVRAKLVEIAGGPRWHTRDEALTEEGRARIVKMTRYLASAATSVVAVHGEIPPADLHAEATRAACFDALLGDLCASGTLVPGGLAVYDRRRDAGPQEVDRATISATRKRQSIHRNLQVRPGRPAREALLWMPDVVAWATRQGLVEQTPQYVEPLSARKTIRIIAVP